MPMLCPFSAALGGKNVTLKNTCTQTTPGRRKFLKSFLLSFLSGASLSFLAQVCPLLQPRPMWQNICVETAFGGEPKRPKVSPNKCCRDNRVQSRLKKIVILDKADREAKNEQKNRNGESSRFYNSVKPTQFSLKARIADLKDTQWAITCTSHVRKRSHFTSAFQSNCAILVTCVPNIECSIS